MFGSILGLILFVVFVIVIVIQLIYYWKYFVRVAFYKPLQHTSTQTNPVSIIICVRDESQNLIENLPLLLKQHYPYTHELVIINDNSLDNSQDIIEQYRKEYKHINVVHLTEEAKFMQGKKFPLSMGIKIAKHELLLLTDADCTPATDEWINSMQQCFKPGKEIVIGYGPYKKQKGLLNKIIRFETFHTALQYLSYALAGNAYMGVGRNLAYVKSLFTEHKGFAKHATVISGDDDLFVNTAATATNVAVNMDPKSFVYSNPKTTWKDWFTQKRRHMGTAKYYKPVHKMLLGVYSASQILLYPLFIATLILLWQQWPTFITVLSVFLIRYITLIIIWFNAMQKLQENDLKKWFWFFDIWMLFYFIRFAPAAFKKNTTQWK
jgi:glycosyltransferase involved in cell wall biosynthesis